MTRDKIFSISMGKYLTMEKNIHKEKGRKNEVYEEKFQERGAN